MSEIKRYECDGYAGQVWMEEEALGEYVKYEDHLAIVDKLIQEAYNKGYDEGRWVGYHELNQDFGVVDKVPYEKYYGAE